MCKGGRSLLRQKRQGVKWTEHCLFLTITEKEGKSMCTHFQGVFLYFTAERMLSHIYIHNYIGWFVHAKLLQSCPTLCLWTIAYQAPLSMEFLRQEDWSGMPFPSPSDPPVPGIDLHPLCLLHWQAGFSLLAPPYRQVYLEYIGIYNIYYIDRYIQYVIQIERHI